MATEESFVNRIMELADLGPNLTCRKMFGEYGFHFDGKFIALACDNSFFIKKTPALADNGLDLPNRPPYTGAKPYPLADELLKSPELLRRVIIESAAYLPEPKQKPKKKSQKKPEKKSGSK